LLNPLFACSCLYFTYIKEYHHWLIPSLIDNFLRKQKPAMHVPSRVF